MVNHGGCACVAAMLAEALRHVFPVMRITSGGNECLDTIRPTLDDVLNKDEWYDNGVYFGHVWVEIFVDDQWYVLDATGVTKTEDFYGNWGTSHEGSFTFEEVEALANSARNRNTWNSSFNRNQLPDIQFAIDSLV